MLTKDLATKLGIFTGNNQPEIRSSRIPVPIITSPSTNQYTSIRSVQTINASDVSNRNHGDTRRTANSNIPVKNKLKGTCSICDGEFRLQSDGHLYKHGHRGNPCGGSSTSPVTGSIIQSQSSQTTNISNSQYSTSQNDGNRASVHNNENRLADDNSTFMHPTHSRGIIKRIPKGSRFATASLPSKLLRKVSDDPDDICSWQKLFNFAPACLIKPTRGGRSRNLTSLINNQVRIYDCSNDDVVGNDDSTSITHLKQDPSKIKDPEKESRQTSIRETGRRRHQRCDSNSMFG